MWKPIAEGEIEFNNDNTIVRRITTDLEIVFYFELHSKAAGRLEFEVLQRVEDDFPV